MINRHNGSHGRTPIQHSTQRQAHAWSSAASVALPACCCQAVSGGGFSLADRCVAGQVGASDLSSSVLSWFDSHQARLAAPSPTAIPTAATALARCNCFRERSLELAFPELKDAGVNRATVLILMRTTRNLAVNRPDPSAPSFRRNMPRIVERQSAVSDPARRVYEVTLRRIGGSSSTRRRQFGGCLDDKCRPVQKGTKRGGSTTQILPHRFAS